MRPSPIQLQHVIYTKIAVSPNTGEKESPAQAVGFDFDGVNIRANVGVGRKEGQEDDPRDFIVRLEIEIDNREGKIVPYDISIGVIGVFQVLPVLAKERREDLITVNGASILYGVIREMVLSLTSRFVSGALTLPGMNFEDNAQSKRTGQSAEHVAALEKPKKPVAARKPRRAH